MVIVTAYHHATAGEHQNQFEGLASDYYPISLSVYREGNVPHYAAVWIKQDLPMPPWVAFHGLNSNEYGEYLKTQRKKEYYPVIITATGGGVLEGAKNDAIYAGVFIKSSDYLIHSDYDISSKTFWDTCAWAKKNNLMLSCAAVYGGRDRLYAGVWKRLRIPKWDFRIYKSFQGPEGGAPVKMREDPSLSLSFVTRSPVGEYLAVYSEPNYDIVERHEMNDESYPGVEKEMRKKHYLPWILQAGADPRFGGDSSNSPKFVAIFRKNHSPYWPLL